MTYTNHDFLVTATTTPAVVIASTPIGLVMLCRPIRTMSQIRKEMMR